MHIIGHNRIYDFSLLEDISRYPYEVVGDRVVEEVNDSPNKEAHDDGTQGDDAKRQLESSEDQCKNYRPFEIETDLCETVDHHHRQFEQLDGASRN